MKKDKYLFDKIGLQHFVRSFFFTLMMFAAISCSEDEPGQAPLDVGLLSASTTEVIINYDTPTEEVVSFGWHAEKTPAIQYQVIFTSGANSRSVDALSEVSRKFTHAELNKILIDDLQLQIGQTANVEVVVKGKVTTSEKTGESNAITIAVTPSDKIIEPELNDFVLSVSKPAVAMNLANPLGETITLAWGDETSAFIHYKVQLSAGNKSASVDVVSAISKEFTNTELNTILVDQLQLPVGQASDVNVKVNGRVTISDKTATSNMVTISMTPVSKVPASPAYPKLWIVGDATPNGWDIGNPNVMSNDPTNVYQFKFNEILNAGEFKIPVTTGNWGADYYMPPVNHPDLTSTSVKFTAGGNPDNKWNLSDGGAYKILLNISSTPFIKITSFTPYEKMYIIGDATSAGWDASNPIEMTVDPGDQNIFTWTGALTSAGRGQFRFLFDTGNLYGSGFVAPLSNASLSATQLALIEENGSANNFKVKPGEEGTYKITINQLKETISIVKQ